METIFALSSGFGRSAIAVVRLSGPKVQSVLADLCPTQPQPRIAHLTTLRDPATGAPLDQALALWFPGPASFTGEDCAEFHVHGSPAVVKTLLTILARRSDCRMAEPGEFARRAFVNGKLDLTEAEGLADLIAADTEAQRVQALSQASGALRTRIESWRCRLIQLSAALEARLDFADEDDVPDPLPADFWSSVQDLSAELRRFLDDSRIAQTIRAGYRVALVGRPNAGKSTLLNALARRDVAIVTEEAGTTRDVLDVSLDLDGYPVILSDSAGIRETDSVAEQAGVERALEAAMAADLVLWLSESGRAEDDNRYAIPSDPDREIGEIWLIDTKSDLKPAADQTQAPDLPFTVARRLALSAKTGAGLQALETALAEHVAERLHAASPTDGVIARQRQFDAVSDALRALEEAMQSHTLSEELVAEYLRACRAALGRVTGSLGVEDVLDALFSEFCIGK